MKKNRWFWIVGIVGFILDQVTKYWVVQTFPNIGDTIPLWSGVFHFTYVINTGAAFSFFEGGAKWLRWLSLGVSLGLMALAWWGEKMKVTEQLGYGFILSGALGNGLDRFLFGYVVDFLDFRLINFPVFNLADVFINIGILFLLIASFGSQSSGKVS
ncbi:signal peptidase II [Crocosphaera chwakensis]|uniref:Lipoprotein signal peptidase n=1 Tax=Crocosphaera chwakensis CCY0110 TaxID=391612 RepID=A3INZ5_9CHRO|nr:signal peptidase II [Crocosphaera chwakensis]EAZ91797.1 signal peptidase II [Crocosphaera chwakensis CCY0110]